MKTINNLLQSPLRWFVLGFILTPIFALGYSLGNSATIQAVFSPYDSLLKSKSQTYAEQILKSGRQSQISRSLVSLKTNSFTPLTSAGVRVAGLTDDIEISEHRVNRIGKEDAISGPHLLVEQGLIRRFPELPLHKEVKVQPSIDELILYSSLTDGQTYRFDDRKKLNMETGGEQLSLWKLQKRSSRQKQVDIPVPVLKNEFLKRSKRYYGTNLSYKARQKEHRCLAIGIYFEARGEPKRGQLAVAQVIMNRVKERFYPNTICKVVWQGSHRRTGCQFSFTCDGLSDRPRSWRKWRLAKTLARRVMDGKVWLKDIGNASHYHATYVSPKWKRGMWRRKRIGLHIFYRGKFLHRRHTRKRWRRAYRKRRNT